jgi:hypothetical protein
MLVTIVPFASQSGETSQIFHQINRSVIISDIRDGGGLGRLAKIFSFFFYFLLFFFEKKIYIFSIFYFLKFNNVAACVKCQLLTGPCVSQLSQLTVN